LAADSRLFIVSATLLSCPQVLLQLLRFWLPELPWLLVVLQPVLCLIGKAFDGMTEELKLCSVLQDFDEFAKPTLI